VDLGILFFLTSGLLLGWSLGANDAANVFGTAVGTRMVRFSTAALVCSVFVILGAVLSGAGAAHTLGQLGSVNALPGSFVAALAAAVTVYAMTKWGLPVSTTQAIVGAIIGWNLFSDSVTDTSALGRILATWVASPLLAGLIAVPVYRAVRALLTRARLHLLRLDAYTRVALLLAGAFGSYSLGANNIGNVMGVFVEVSPFTDFTLPGGVRLSSLQQLFGLGALAIALGVFTYSKRVMLTVGAGLAPMSPVAAWVVVVAHSIVLFVFASEGLEQLLISAGLPAIPLVPVSSSQAVVGAVVGLALMRGGGDVDWRLLAHIALGWLATPLLAALLSFVSLFVVQNVFDQPVYREVHYRLSRAGLEGLERELGPHPWLTALVGREFRSAQAFLEALERHTFLGPGAERRALARAEIHPMEVTREALRGLDREWLGGERAAAVEALLGRRFEYRWELAEALAARSPAWRARPATKANRRYNRALEERLAYLERRLAAAPAR